MIALHPSAQRSRGRWGRAGTRFVLERTTTAPSGAIVLHSPFKGKASIEDKNNMKAIDGIWFIYLFFWNLSLPVVTPNECWFYDVKMNYKKNKK